MVNLHYAKKLALASLALGAAAVPFAFGLVTSGGVASAQVATADGAAWLPVVKVAPRYPLRALERGLEGEVTIEYTVDERGATQDLEVVESSSSLFEQPALEAVSKYKYASYDGVSSDSSGAPVPLPKHGERSLSRFVLEESEDSEGSEGVEKPFLPILHPAPVYPAPARERGLEGFVIVEYTVTEQGRTTDLEVVESSASLFEAPALEAVAQYQYEPRMRNGLAVAVEGVRSVLRFEPPQ